MTTRTASELDIGSLPIVEGGVCKVLRIEDKTDTDGRMWTWMVLKDLRTAVEFSGGWRPSTKFQCFSY